MVVTVSKTGMLRAMLQLSFEVIQATNKLVLMDTVGFEQDIRGIEAEAKRIRRVLAERVIDPKH